MGSDGLAEALDFYYDHPAAFFEDILGIVPDDWQRDVLNDLQQSSRVSVRSGQGVGKTALEAGAIIWFLTCRPYARVVATAPTMQQLYDVLWSEIAKWLSDSKVKSLLKWTKTKVYMIGDEERWFATARTAVKPENMQGFHEDHMLFVVDEASGVADPIMEAILGTLTGEDNKLLMCGNPTKLEGTFYDSHTSDRDKYRCHKVDSRKSNRTNKDSIDMLIRKYGADSDVVRVRVYGEFPGRSQDALIALETVELAMENKIPDSEVKPADRLHIGCDVARFGDDSTVITHRIGMRIAEQVKLSKRDTMETVGAILSVFRRCQKEHPEVKDCWVRVDDTGVGGGVTDRLREVAQESDLPIRVIPVNNGAAAEDEFYHNLGAQLWGQLRDLLEENMSASLQGQAPILQLPRSDELVKQLIGRKYKMSSRGKIQLERKEDMKKRGLESPDCADSLALCLYEPRVARIKFFKDGI